MTGLNLAADSGAELALLGMDLTLVIVVLAVALLALAVAGTLVREVLAASQGTERMQNIARAVQEGAAAYLKRQFRTLAVFVIIIPLLLLLLPADTEAVRWGRSIFFAIGALFSAMTGFLGMWLAVRGNLRVAAAARAGEARAAMRIAFRTGGVAGMFTVGLGLLGAALVVLIYRADAPIVLEGFGFGAALLAMFMRVGGGIFTKAADVGADLVGKVEHHIPEDDPRNAATIADNVGDNVGDCAGMAADLFESYAVVLVASLVLGRVAFGTEGLVFPLLVPMIGVITAIIGIFVVSPRARDANAMAAINRGFFISAVISAVLVVGAALLYLPDTFAELEGVPADIAALDGNPQLIAIGAVLIGLLLAAAIQLLTGYFTETNRPPVREIGESSRSGPATVVLAGVSVGLESAVYSALLIAGAVYAAFLLGGGNITVSLFAVALAGTGLLTTVGVIVAMDTFGPVADNAQGIAEMSGDVEGSGAEVLNSLDAVGNTTKAITKGIAIATAVLAATALFGAFRTAVEAELGATEFSLSVDQPDVLVGVIIGAAVVFLFSGLAIMAVGRAAGRVVHEVREQFRTRPGIMDGTEKPEYGRVVDICTRDSLRELITPGLLAVLTPIALGFALGYAPLGAFLGGGIAAGALMAVFLANSGGAWDNAKKLVEDGHYGGKGSEAHEATVIGDTIGDPFKDTAGPAINPLLKVMNLVALLIAPSVVIYADNLALRLGITVASVALLVGVIVWSKRRSTDGSFAAEATKTQPEAPAADQGAAKEEPVSQGGGASSQE
ncbi:sodium-translocating pyrophosphatase [Thermobifida fusca]|mgnify:FL=1|uniref:K(+)-insensitive pyrophosphate-energized proton pump n=1 Tax=Thermobifida fusca TM51 TaxID=1169414 RepID=A0A9P2TE13_THEFU|nr:MULTISPECIES: sodium-translocating pyrophosphatase [Thermobifida]EOR72775.1 membrane-bound proton-translocating pyrophosphatase [Thermobifida fusca TM51]MBO2528736.1 sodium-translocating pyrophosphatase [Thermobifida sp.]PPS92387.1 potassium transporter [Thermobifida fusca]PZN66633.1 MAG: sodium-translocating pyrophosphatase [Thermobifida fusca]QOS59738.1 sodium-translocating pyrophosphatase [Thermobifida fusca]